MINIEEFIKHQEHKTSPEKIIIKGDDVLFTKYCFDCDEEYIVEKDKNGWNFERNVPCPHCGKEASVSSKYFQDGNLVRKKTWTHCFSCNYTDEH